ncbi:hypothetical protein BDZ97DRAFT_432100 [Flammula alnicola]|nr:hypothetical protein BDZ97DRAFT_432100 [Flammula alnicola]
MARRSFSTHHIHLSVILLSLLWGHWSSSFVRRFWSCAYLRPLSGHKNWFLLSIFHHGTALSLDNSSSLNSSTFTSNLTPSSSLIVIFIVSSLSLSLSSCIAQFHVASLFADLFRSGCYTDSSNRHIFSSSHSIFLSLDFDIYLSSHLFLSFISASSP